MEKLDPDQLFVKEAGQGEGMPVDSEPRIAAQRTHKERRGIRLKRYLRAEVSTEHADVLLLWCCLISGLLDSVVYSGMSAWNRHRASGSNLRTHG